jgi:Tol biopolymer transport system component
MMVAALALVIAAVTFGVVGVTRWITAPAIPGNFDSMRLSKLTYTGNAEGGNIAVSPDGKQIAYTVQNAGGHSLWLKPVSASSGTEIVPSADVAYQGLTFSRKGDYIYYSVIENTGASEIRRIPVSGGESQQIVSSAQGPISFSPQGDKFAFIRDDVAILIADADGGNIRRLAVCTGGTSWWMPTWSTRGDKIAAALYSPEDSTVRLVEVSVNDGSQRDISPSRWLNVNGLAWLPDNAGLIIIGRDPETQFSQFWRMSYPGGELRRITNDMASYVGLSVTSDAGAAVTVQESRVTNIWVAPEANPASQKKITTEVGRDEGLSGLAWTSDGRIVYTTRLAGTQDLWIVGREGQNNRQLTAEAKSNFSPVVTPDGRSIVFLSDRDGRVDLWKMNIDGSDAVRLTDTVDTEAFPDISPDGKWIVYQVEDEHNRSTIWRLPIGGGTPIKLTNVQSGWPRVSPDGKYIVCIYGQDDITARKDAAIIPFNGGEPIKQFRIPTANFRWSSDGRSIIYLSDGTGAHGLRSLSLDEGTERNLGDFGSEFLFRLDLSKYGLAVARGTETSDVVLVSNFK